MKARLHCSMIELSWGQSYSLKLICRVVHVEMFKMYGPDTQLVFTPRRIYSYVNICTMQTFLLKSKVVPLCVHTYGNDLSIRMCERKYTSVLLWNFECLTSMIVVAHIVPSYSYTSDQLLF